MSQAGRFSTGGGPIGSVTQINGDTGFANGPTINLIVGNSYGSSRFIGDNANTINLEFSDVDNNTGIGFQSLIQNPHGSNNVALGNFTLVTNSSGTDNTAIGLGSGSSIQTGNFNTTIGSDSGANFDGGSFNICIGNTAGNAMLNAESHNIFLNSTGVLAESNALRIGQATGTGTRELSTAFICGIEGVDVGSVATVVTIDSDQLGSATITAGTGISVTPGANTITIASTGGGGTLDTLTGDTGGPVSPTAANINVLGAHGINTSGAGSTLTVAINNTVTLGDLSLLTAGNAALTLTSGDLTISGTGVNAAGNLNLPTTSSTGVSGVIEVNGNRFMHSFGADNTFLGSNAGALTSIGSSNVGIGSSSQQVAGNNAIGNTSVGHQTLRDNTDGAFNIAIGLQALSSLIDADENLAIGVGALINLTGGESNVAIGRVNDGAGHNYTGLESSNVVIQNEGVLGESNTMRIGTTGSGNGQQNRTFMAGVQGVNVGSTATVVTMVTEQMGTAAITAGTGISVTPGANTITIAATGGSFTWSEVTGTSQAMAINNGYILNNVGLVTATLPSTAALGSVVRIAGKGAGGWRLAQNSGQTIFFGSSTTTPGTGGSLSSTNRRDCVELVCVTADTDWDVLSVQGNLTVV